MNEANDNDLGWQLLFNEDGIWLNWRDGEQAINLGAEQPVLSYLADLMAQRDFGE